MNTTSLIEPASNPKVEHNTRAFLKGLNSAEGPPLAEGGSRLCFHLFVGNQLASRCRSTIW
jgi:hypothetical protein